MNNFKFEEVKHCGEKSRNKQEKGKNNYEY